MFMFRQAQFLASNLCGFYIAAYFIIRKLKPSKSGGPTGGLTIGIRCFATPSVVILTGSIKPLASKVILSMQVTRLLASVSPSGRR